MFNFSIFLHSCIHYIILFVSIQVCWLSTIKPTLLVGRIMRTVGTTPQPVFCSIRTTSMAVTESNYCLRFLLTWSSGVSPIFKDICRVLLLYGWSKFTKQGVESRTACILSRQLCPEGMCRLPPYIWRITCRLAEEWGSNHSKKLMQRTI